MKNSLLKVLQEIARVTPEAIPENSAAIAELDISRRYAPHVYFAYFSLLESIARSNAIAVSERCAALGESLRAPYCDAFEVREDVDDIALSFMRARHTTTESDTCHVEFSPNAAKRDGLTRTAHGPIAPSVARVARHQLAWLRAAIAAGDPDLADEIGNMVSVVQLMPNSFSAEAASSLSTFGMVLLRPLQNASGPCEQFFYFDRLIHEAAHLYLNMLMTFDPLVRNGAALAPSPARQTLRPVKGVLHAHFVFFRLLIAFRKAPGLVREADEPGVSTEQVAHRAISALPLSFRVRQAVYRERFMQGDSILRSSAEFTTHGRVFLDSLREVICHG